MKHSERLNGDLKPEHKKITDSTMKTGGSFTVADPNNVF